MQDVLLEPYGGRVMHLPVGATTGLTALLAIGGGAGLGLAARALNRGADPYRVAGFGAAACKLFASRCCRRSARIRNWRMRSRGWMCFHRWRAWRTSGGTAGRW